MSSRNHNAGNPASDIQFPLFFYYKHDDMQSFYAHMSRTEVLCIDIPSDGSLPRIGSSCIPDLWKYNAAYCVRIDYASFCNGKLLAESAFSAFIAPAFSLDEYNDECWIEPVSEPIDPEYSSVLYCDDLETFVDNQGIEIDWRSQPDTQPVCYYEEPVEDYHELQLRDTIQISSPVKKRA